jgi:hypothetical protein
LSIVILALLQSQESLQRRRRRPEEQINTETHDDCRPLTSSVQSRFDSVVKLESLFPLISLNCFSFDKKAFRGQLMKPLGASMRMSQVESTQLSYVTLIDGTNNPIRGSLNVWQ